MKQKQTNLIDAHLGLINYLQEKRYSYERWKNIVNFVIYKEIRNNKIHKNCILHQHEADYSLNIGYLWKEMITMSEKRGAIDREYMVEGNAVMRKHYPSLKNLNMIFHTA
eukprot:576651-Ditylum_brightwellii.AAC.1